MLVRLRAFHHSRIVSASEVSIPAPWLPSLAAGTRSRRPQSSPKGGGFTGAGCGPAGCTLPVWGPVTGLPAQQSGDSCAHSVKMVRAENRTSRSRVMTARIQGGPPGAHGVRLSHLEEWLGPGSWKPALPHLAKRGGAGEKLPGLLGDEDHIG